jgi:hypothetical protein
VRASRFLWLLGLAALGGMGIFGVMAWRAVDIVDAVPAEAGAQFDRARGRFGGEAPILAVDNQGRLVRRVTEPASPGAPITHLRVLSYRAAAGRLTRASVPLWFLKIKGPAAQLLLRDTGLDLAALRLTASDLEALGPAIILDRIGAAGDRMLVWTD